MDAFCHIPYDAAHPDPASGWPVMDWGKVTKVEQLTGTLGDEQIDLEVLEIAGQRARYRVKNSGLIGHLADVQVGQLLALCPEDESDVYRLPGGPLTVTHEVVSLSAPPRVAEFARFAPRHMTSIAIRVAADHGKLAPGHYLVHARIGAADGDRFEIDHWWIRATPDAPGRDLIAPGAWLWLVLGDPQFEDGPGGRRLILRVDAAITELFP